MSDTTTPATFPDNWKIAQDYNPNDHLMQLSGRDYLNVQNRLLWFIRDQRALIVAGLAKVPYIVNTELVEMDKASSWAHFKTYVRDVLGNEATMYGSESVKDFKDFAEKASTKSLGRALLALGYGTAFAPEMDEGDRVVDTPVERRTNDNAASTAKTTTTTNGNGNTNKRQPAQAQARQPQAKAATMPESAPQDVAPLADNLQRILDANPDLRATYRIAGQYGLVGAQFFSELARVAGITKQDGKTTPITAAHKEAMAAYVLTLAQQAKAAAARTPDLATVATPGVRA